MTIRCVTCIDFLFKYYILKRKTMNTKENRLLIFSLLYAVTMFSCVHLSLKGPNLWRNLFVGSMILILIRWVLYMGIIKKDFKKMTRAPTHCNALQAGAFFIDYCTKKALHRECFCMPFCSFFGNKYSL